MKKYDLLIIGGGCAGIAAAIAAYGSGISKIALVERSDILGGILNQCIHSGFGLERYGKELTGPEFAKSLLCEFRKISADLYTETTVLDLTKDTAVISGKHGYEKLRFDAVILACGCRETPIGALPVTGTRPAGIFTAGQAQSMINLKKMDIGDDVVILGSGDVGLIVARRLKILGKNVIAVLEKSDHCGGLERNRVNCLDAYDIPLKLNTTVTEVCGTGRISGVYAKDLTTGECSYIPCKTLITSVGLVPERDLLESFGNNALPKNVFLCGNCRTVFDTADSAASDGAETGRLAAEFLKTGIRTYSSHPEKSARPLKENETLCLECPRGCILSVKNGRKSGGRCKKFT
ncbi:MAG: NAD(P)/FAD-dependent oxidoreductase [Oscillospiraceae bacterium]|nr:NAD(P)/FAD-dependent oxidoreductase [Oscillospiraceae bacterium]